MRCIVCGKVIRGKPIVRKTCCVNKLYVFCSWKCMKLWTQQWLKREGAAVVKRNMVKGKML